MTFNLGDAAVNLVLGPTAGFEKQVAAAAGNAADQAGQSAGSRLQSALGKVLTPTKIGAGIGVLFAGATEAASKFEDQLRTINTVAHLSDSELAGVGESIKALSSETGRSLDDLTSGFYDLVSAGVPADKAMQTLSDSAKLAVGNLGSTGEAVDIVTTALNAFKIDASESAHVTDVFAQAVADGKTTVAGLSEGIARVAPIAANAGISLEEVAAATARMTLNGASASQAYTYMASAINALLTPNAELNTLQKQTGKNFAELAKTKGLAVALDELRQATNGDTEAFAKALGSSEALTFALSLTGDNAAAMAAELDRIKHSSDGGGVSLQQYAEKMKSPIEQGRKLVATLQNIIVGVGAPFVSTIGPAIFAVNQLGAAFGAGGIAGKAFGGAIGAAVGRISGNLIPALSKVLKGSLGVAFATAGESAALGAAKLSTKIVTGLQIPLENALFKLVPGLFNDAGNLAAGSFVKSFLANNALGRLAATAASIIGPIAIAATVVFVGGQIAQGVQDANAKDLSDKLSAALEAGTDDAFQQAEKHLADLERGARASHNDSWLNIILGQKAAFEKAAQDRARVLEQSENHLAQEAAKAGTTTGDSFADAMAAATAAGITANASRASDAVARANAKLAKATGGPVASIFTAAGRRLMDSVAQGIEAERNKPLDAFKTLQDMLKKQLTPTAERARLIGELTSKALAQGLKSKDPEVRAQAQYVKQTIIDRLNALGANSKNIGKKGMEELRKGMRSKDPDIRAAATAIYNAAAGKGPGLGPADLPAAGKKWGAGLVSGLTTGMLLKQAGVVARSRAIATAIANELRPGSPTKTGPLSEGGGMEGWGQKLAAQFAKGIDRALPQTRASIRAHAVTVEQAINRAQAAIGHGFLGRYDMPGTGPAGFQRHILPVGAPRPLVGALAGSHAMAGGGATFGDIHIHLHDVGNDVSPQRAAKFGEQVAKSMAQNFRVDGARLGIHPRRT